jgi:hypothetical protein
MLEFGVVTPTTPYKGENNSIFSRVHFSAERKRVLKKLITKSFN